MELTKEELVFILQMLQQVNFQQAEGKIQAGQLQTKIEAQLASLAPSPPQSEQE